MRKLRVLSERDWIDCDRYHARLLASTCSARHALGNREYTVAERRRGEHFRTPDVVGCRGCEVGASVTHQLERLALRRNAEAALRSAREAMQDEIEARARVLAELARAEVLSSAEAAMGRAEELENPSAPTAEVASAQSMHEPYKVKRGSST